MAGNYTDYPDHRFAYDRDGTQMFWVNLVAGTVTQFTTADMEKLNNESDDDVAMLAQTSAPGAAFGFIFPELRDLSGYQMYCGGSHSGFVAGNVDTSVDTTNFIDGTWTSQGTFQHNASDPSKVGMRESIASISASGVRAVRFRFTHTNATCRWDWMHLFGTITAGENPDRLAIWHPTLDQRVDPAHFDWGDAPRNSSDDVTFRVKNLSPTLTASTIVVDVECPTDTTPSVAGQHTISNGGAFAASQTIASLAPGAISTVHTLRRTTPTNAVLSLWFPRIKAVAGSWA